MRTLRRRPRDPGVRAYWLVTLAIALALSVRPAPCYLAISQLAGMPNAARLLDNALILVAPADAPADGAGGVDLDGEARFLATVSRHLERSALVRAALSGPAGHPAREPAG